MTGCVRPAVEKDWVEINLLMGRLRGELSTLYPLAPWTETAQSYKEKIRSSIREHEGAAFLVEKNGSICGYSIGWVVAEDDFESRSDHLRYGRIEELYVLPEARREGMGTRVLAALMDDLKSKGISHVNLGALNNNAPAIAFYRRAGFESYFTVMKTAF